MYAAAVLFFPATHQPSDWRAGRNSLDTHESESQSKTCCRHSKSTASKQLSPCLKVEAAWRNRSNYSTSISPFIPRAVKLEQIAKKGTPIACIWSAAIRSGSGRACSSPLDTHLSISWNVTVTVTVPCFIEITYDVISRAETISSNCTSSKVMTVHPR